MPRFVEETEASRTKHGFKMRRIPVLP